MCKDCKECKLLLQPFKKKRHKKTKAFKEIKKEIFKRDGWKCTICGSTDDLTVHHLKGGDDLDNLICVCRQCHKKLHSNKIIYDNN